MEPRQAIRVLLGVLGAAAALALAGCGGGGGDATFSTSGFDAIKVGDSADSVTDAIGEPAATQDLVPGGGDPGPSSVWIYCDGPRPYYLMITGDEVVQDDLTMPDELRLTVENCS
ncbi:MAG: hypothetical protein U0R51_04335 [Solirubrobacterales bacterium]